MTQNTKSAAGHMSSWTKPVSQGSKVSHGSFDKRDQLLSNDDRNTLADGEIPWLPERRERKRIFFLCQSEVKKYSMNCNC